jgi:hypothetical protein
MARGSSAVGVWIRGDMSATRMEIRITCKPDVHDSALDLGSSAIVVTDARPSQQFTFNATSNRACALPFAEPATPNATRETPPDDAPVVLALNRDVGSREHVGLNLKHIE